jgi:hypothetical protein
MTNLRMTRGGYGILRFCDQGWDDDRDDGEQGE